MVIFNGLPEDVKCVIICPVQVAAVRILHGTSIRPSETVLSIRCTMWYNFRAHCLGVFPKGQC